MSETFSLNNPINWTVAKLEDLVIKFVGGGTPSKQNSAYYQGNIPWMSVKDMTTHRPQAVSDHITLEAVANSATNLIPPDTIIIATRMSLGKVVRVPFEVAINQDLKALILPKDIEKDFIEYWFLAEASHIQSLGTGTTVKGIRLEVLQQLEVPLPPLNEQRRIVAKIEALKARSQRVKEELEAIAPLLDQFRQSVLAAAFRGDLTADWREKNPDVEPASVLLECIRAERRRRWEEAELEKMKARGKTAKNDDWKAKYKEPKSFEDIPINYPVSWTWARAEEVCDFITKGTTPAPNKMFEQSGDIPFIKVYNLTNRGFLDFSINPTFISKEVHSGELARSKVFPGDILMNIVGPPLGKVAIVPDDYKEWNMNQAIAVYRAMPGIENRFLTYCLLSTPILSTAVHAAKATAGQFNLTLEICRDLPLPIPPTSEQQQIVAMIDRCFAAADLIAEQLANAASQNDVLNQSILAKAFRGELVPQDPNDEPASVLLERIRVERENLDTKKKAKGKTEKKSCKAKPEAAEPKQLSLPGFE